MTLEQYYGLKHPTHFKAPVNGKDGCQGLEDASIFTWALRFQNRLSYKITTLHKELQNLAPRPSYNVPYRFFIDNPK